MPRLTRITATGLIALVLMASAAAAQVAIGFGGTPHDSDEPVEVVSDSLRIDQETGLAVFTGNVIVVQGDLRMAAAEVRVTYFENADGTEVDRVLASGGVLMTRGEDAAEGQNAVYTVDSGEVVMTGSVLVTQGATTVAGERLTIDLNTGDGVVSGRVRTVLSRDDD
jgi:lipopolysaccharide export system protein LptA